MFKIIPLIAIASVSSIWAWCFKTPQINLCHPTESGYVTLRVPEDTKLGEGDFKYEGPVDKHGKPNEAGTEWCNEHVPPVEEPPVVTPPVETPKVETPAPTELPKTGGSF